MRSILDPLLGPLHFLEFSVCSFQSMLIIRLIISLLARGPAERLIGEKDILHPDAERRLIHMQITLDIDDTIAALLATLDDEGFPPRTPLMNWFPTPCRAFTAPGLGSGPS